METFNNLIEIVKSGRFVSKLNVVDVAKTLDERDTTAFDRMWSDRYEISQDFNLGADAEIEEECRKLLFDSVYDRGLAPELAEVVSEDFGLIAAFVHAGRFDHWIACLLKSYLNGILPAGEMNESKVNSYDELM